MTSGSGTESALISLSNAMAEAVERASAAIVTVDARRRFPASGVGYGGDLILTADHVVQRDEDIRVLLPDGTELSATVVGRDPGSDLALLRIDRAVLSVATPSESEARVGQLVLALGRPSSEGVQASLGVVSAVEGPVRTRQGGMLERYIRTDAIPYPGFSGGPLIDGEGRLLGINTSGLSRGASISIPVVQAWKIAETLQQHGRVRRGYLGIRSQPVNIPADQQGALGREQSSGLLIVGVENGSPAAEGGLIVGDILVGAAGTVVADIDELQSQLLGATVGKSLDIEVLRGGQPQTLRVTVGER